LLFSSSTSTRGDKQPFVDPSNTLIKDHFYSSFDDEKFITLQKEYSAKARGMTVPEYEQWERNVKQSAADAVTGDQAYVQTQQVERKSTWITSPQQHLDHQQKVFDTMSSTFYQMEEDEQRVQPVLKHVTKRAIQQMMESIQEGQDKRKTTTQGNHNATTLQGGGQVYQLLDVGCGTGSLFPHLLQAAKDAKIRFHLTGVDLSPKMIEYATIHAENLLDDFPSGFQFDFEAMDFVQMVMGSSGYDCGGDDGLVTGYDNNKGPVDDTTMKHRGKYDAVLFNSCFGNFFDPGMAFS
jgi:SAM-dependent methyltransferase